MTKHVLLVTIEAEMQGKSIVCTMYVHVQGNGGGERKKERKEKKGRAKELALTSGTPNIAIYIYTNTYIL